MASRENTSFAASIPPYLHVGTRLRVYHVSTPATLHAPVFAALPNQPEELTTCESHFLGVTQISDRSSGISDPSPEILVLGIEVLIFATPNLSTIFVSKADSTGFLVRPSSTSNKAPPAETPRQPPSKSSTTEAINLGLKPRTSNSTAQVVITAFLLFLVKANLAQYASSRLVLSLFARSQSQYLFPGSVENSSKHVLDDRQLIKWWCKVLDPLLKPDPSPRISESIISVSTSLYAQAHSHDTEDDHASRSGLAALTGATAYILVPGCDRSEIWRSFLPASAKLSVASKLPDSESKWRVSFPVSELRPDRTAAVSAPAIVGEVGHAENGRDDLVSDHVALTNLPVQCLIPRLPDDPKARFCDDLDASVDAQGRWRGVKTLEEFWELMGYRQECSAGRVVGFVWVVFDTPANDSGKTKHAEQPQPCQAGIKSADNADQPSSNAPEKVTLEREAGTRTHQDTASKIDSVASTYSKATDFVVDHTVEKLDPADELPSSQNPPDLKPLSTTRIGSTLLTKEQYETLSAHIINDLDFAGLDKGIESTASWIQKLQELSGQHEVGKTVDGLAEVSNIGSQTSTRDLQTSDSMSVSMNAEPQVNVLTAIRKKKRKAVELEGGQ